MLAPIIAQRSEENLPTASFAVDRALRSPLDRTPALRGRYAMLVLTPARCCFPFSRRVSRRCRVAQLTPGGPFHPASKGDARLPGRRKPPLRAQPSAAVRASCDAPRDEEEQLRQAPTPLVSLRTWRARAPRALPAGRACE